MVALMFGLLIATTSCRDEPLFDMEEIGEGIGDIRATVSFLQPEPALESRAAGNAVGTVSDMWVVLYEINPTGGTDFYGKYHVSAGGYGYQCNQTGNSSEPSDAETGDNLGATGERTPHADFRIDGIPFGKYKMYAVANVPDLSDEDVATEEALKSKNFTWKTTVSENNAMFGYFTSATGQTSQGFDAPVLYVNRKTVDLHAWIKRMVSKVTVAFDPTGLKESVWVYVKSITIHDIPTDCRLGVNNTPDAASELITNGESINYYTAATADDHEKWSLVLSKGSGVQGSSHSNTANALYFFENMQGNYPGQKEYLKEQIPDETGTAIDAPDADGTNDYKDRIKYGSYIEVVGYYLSKNKEKLSSGPIRYRFMLGKDITYNYDAERNFHYKLTLKLRGFANEADWHISYTEQTPTVFTPDKYYISYLYGQSLQFPVRVLTGDDNVRKYKVKAEIIENNWCPFDEPTNSLPPTSVGSMTNINGMAWNKAAYDNVYKKYDTVSKQCAFGFLSLRQPTAGFLYPAGTNQNTMYGSDTNDKLISYYTTNKIGEAEYSLATDGTFNIDGKSNQGSYSVKYDAQDKSVSLLVPMYTRQEKMVPMTDFSGNNPYSRYMRKATVRFTLWDGDKQVAFKDEDGNDIMQRDVPILQVRRVENPKAIYRAHDKTDPFDVTLMIVPNAEDNTTTFEALTSDGPWRASILADPNGLIKLTKDGQTVTSAGQYITGVTDSEIAFTYQPNGTIGADETRCGIILVEYHDYACRHLIFVRQGYNKGVTLGDATWSCFNVYATGKSTTSYVPEDLTTVSVATTASPLSIGSYLKRNQYNYSIREANNDQYGWMKSVTGKDLSVAYLDGTTVKTKNAQWGNIQGYAWRSYDGASYRYDKQWADTWNGVGAQKDKTFTVPTAAQYQSIIDKQLDHGYGVAYADGASATATSIADAFGFTDYNNDNNNGSGSAKGTRVCVVYNRSNGDNVLFPMGNEGQARRPISVKAVSGTESLVAVMPDTGPGALSYSGFRGVLQNSDYRPLTYNIYRHAGAVYWVKQPIHSGNNATYTKFNSAFASWDVGYFTFVFNHYDYGSLGGYLDGSKTCTTATSSDALPIKLIYK